MPAVVIHKCMFSNSSEFIYRTSLLGVTISTRLQQIYYQQQQHMSHFLTNHFTNQHHHPLLTMLTCIVKRLRARFSCLAETKLDIYTFGIFSRVKKLLKRFLQRMRQRAATATLKITIAMETKSHIPADIIRVSGI